MKLRQPDYGHYAAPVAMWTLALSAAFDILTFVVSVPLFVILVITPLTMIVLVASLVALYLHARRLCESCARSMPLDCAQQAQKQRVHLHLVHVLDSNKKAYWGVLIALIVALIIVHGVAAVVLSVLFKLSGAEIVYGSVTHKKLQPWCPWCGERGIELLTTPTRTPVGTGA